MRICGNICSQNANKTDTPILSASDEKKWVELGFSPKIISSHPDCVAFLFTSHLVYSIASFHNSFELGSAIELDQDDHPLIKMDGKWCRWEQIKQLIDYDPTHASLIAKGNPAICYNYIHPDGIVQKDYAAYDKLYPVAQLSQTQHAELQAHAKQFWNTNSEIDPEENKDCVLQIVTTRRDICRRNWFTENLLDNIPEHVHMRVIDKQGRLYSFGMKVASSAAAEVYKSVPFTYLTTAPSTITTPDFEESRKFDERRVTSIPLTEERKTAILEYIEKTNSKGVSFNYAKQNCSKLAEIVLAKAGVKISTRLTFNRLLMRLLPSPSRLPIVGVLFKIANAVAAAVSRLFARVVQAIPAPIKRIYSVCIEYLLHVPQTIQAIFNNTLALILGAGRTTSQTVQTPHDTKHDDNNLTIFPRLINNFKDFFTYEKSHSYFSPLMVEWQLKQASTHIYTYDKPRMYI
jgi:hypothetical protein